MFVPTESVKEIDGREDEVALREKDGCSYDADWRKMVVATERSGGSGIREGRSASGEGCRSKNGCSYGGGEKKEKKGEGCVVYWKKMFVPTETFSG